MSVETRGRAQAGWVVRRQRKKNTEHASLVLSFPSFISSATLATALDWNHPHSHTHMCASQSHPQATLTQPGNNENQPSREASVLSKCLDCKDGSRPEF